MSKQNSIFLYLSELSDRRKAAAVVLVMLFGGIVTDSGFVTDTETSDTTGEAEVSSNEFDDVEGMLAEFESMTKEQAGIQSKQPSELVASSPADGTAAAGATITIPSATTQSPAAQNVSYSTVPTANLPTSQNDVPTTHVGIHSTVDVSQRQNHPAAPGPARIRLTGTIVTTP